MYITSSLLRFSIAIIFGDRIMRQLSGYYNFCNFIFALFHQITKEEVDNISASRTYYFRYVIALVELAQRIMEYIKNNSNQTLYFTLTNLYILIQQIIIRENLIKVSQLHR